MSDRRTREDEPSSDERCFVNVGWKHPGVPGFISVDVDFDPALSEELSDGFPFDEGSVDGILCEDLIHRLPRADGINLLRSCRRVMADGAVLRLATMDLQSVTRSYLEMVAQPEQHQRGRPCELLNTLFEADATRWVYDEDELIRMGRLAGLKFVGRQAAGTSTEPVYRQRTDFPHCDLILEFTLPDRTPEEDPMVSVLIPASRPEYFREALQSAVEQSWTNLEVVVCDDSDGPEIQAICEEVAGDDGRVQYHRNSSPLTFRETCHRLMELSSGAYIKFLTDDDVLHPESVERLCCCLQAYPWVTLATSYRQVVDSAGEPMLRRGDNSRLVFEDSIVDGLSALNLMLETRCNFIGGLSAALFRRRDVMDAQSGIMSFHGVEGGPVWDTTLWMQLLSRGELVYLVQGLVEYRQHPDQMHRQPDYDDRADVAWAQLKAAGRQMGFLVDGVRFNLKSRPLATRPWWSNVVTRIYREASERVNEKGLADASEALLRLNAMLPDEPWPPVVLAEALLAANSLEKALTVMSPNLSRHRDYFPAYALAGSALASLGKGEDAAAVFAEGCVWALPVFSTGGVTLGVGEPCDLTDPIHVWIQTGRFHFGISFKLVVASVPADSSLPIVVPVSVNGELASECSFYGVGDSTVLTLETPRDSQNTVLRLGPVDETGQEEEHGIRLRVQDFNIVLLGKLT